MTRKRALHALVAAAAVAGIAVIARADDPWHLMPESASAEADTIDGLTYLILWITGITFVVVQALLVLFLVKYRARPGQKSKYTHGNHAVELVWTVTPALILVFLALYQMGLWVELKKPIPADNQGATEIQVFAKQFEWNGRYAGPDGQFGTNDDRLTVNSFVVPVNRPVNVTMRAMDVIHSFYLPNFRFKQDAVPGLKIPFWFRPTKLSANRKHADGTPMMNRGTPPSQIHYWDVVCAELCGISHTAMGAQLFVVSEEDYAKWQKDPRSVAGLPGWTVWNKDNAMGAPDTVWVRWEWQERQYDDKGRVKMHPAKKAREPFGEEAQPAGDESTSEDI